jgi:hypothetical protein
MAERPAGLGVRNGLTASVVEIRPGPLALMLEIIIISFWLQI